MSNTYRRVMVYVKDGAHTCGNNARKSRSRNKPMDRRIQRRQNAKLIQEATRSFLEDTEFDILDTIDYSSADDFNEWYSEHQFDDLVDEYPYDPFWDIEYNESPYNYDHDPYDNEDLSYAGGSLSKQGLTSFDMNARITEQDAGKSLGDILQEIINKRGE